MQDILFRVRVKQIYQKLLAKHPTTVTPAAIAAYYSSHQSQFGTAETRNMQIVLTKTLAQADRRQEGAGEGRQSWTAVAKKYSIDPTTKNNGGLLTGVTKGQQDAGADHGRVRGADEQAHRPGQGPVRLLRVRGHQDHPGHPADAGAVDAR